MKKKFLLISLCILGVSVFLGAGKPIKVCADSPTFNNKQDAKDYQKVHYSELKKETLEQGYSEEQFTDMMNIPYLEPEEDVSKFYDEQNPIMSRAFLRATMSNGEKLVAEAKKYIGTPYGTATPPKQFTCDRLINYTYAKALGMNLPGVTTNQEKLGTEVSLNSLQPGDLIFWGNRGATYHVAMYIGGNQYIHAPDYGQTVQINTISPYFQPSFARRIIATDNGKEPNNDGQKAGEQYIHRLYNVNAGQHHYTGVLYEAQSLKKAGWSYEGVGWVAPTKGADVYRLYNPNNGRHLYTTSSFERDSLVKAGWKAEGVSWHSGGNLPVYRLYNPNAKGNADSHTYTMNTYERDNLIKAGWQSNGIAWYALRAINN
ncbi:MULTISPECIES: NlpC/P60 family protein [Lactococcus]|uniref:Cell wall surface anchor family protein n=1 Tax=Lactococcus lactis subsp. cremoris TaxID=1359 RepID=A0A166IQB3_LACLC|nr:NlpC/P60 family protein [Lactococcus cremoris]KZK04746.1 Cell wall surface anchor family protein [Lactococcus cremoris]